MRRSPPPAIDTTRIAVSRQSLDFSVLVICGDRYAHNAIDVTVATTHARQSACSNNAEMSTSRARAMRCRTSTDGFRTPLSTPLM